MKKLWILGLSVLLLSGCRSVTTFETIEDNYVASAMAPARQLQLTLPEEAAQTVMESQGNSLYFCNGFTICLQTLASGDLDRSLRQMTGFSKDALTVVETQSNGIRRYDTAWSAAGEGGAQTARACRLARRHRQRWS